MKIHDITKFASPTDIKPEINAVYVKHLVDGIVYVATDSYKLIEIVEHDNGFLKSMLREGFYTPVQWKIIAKATAGKKKDFKTVQMVGASEDYLPKGHFPDYKQLYEGKTTTSADFNVGKFDPKHICEAINIAKKLGVSQFFEPVEWVQTTNEFGVRKSGMYLYQKQNITICLMAINR